MNDFVLELAAFGVALFCFVDCMRNRPGLYLPLKKGWTNRLKDQHFVYLALLITMLISSLSCVFEVSIENHYIPGSVWALYLINQLYFIFHTALALMFALYIIDITGALKDKGRTFFALFLTPLGIGEFIILINPFTKLLYWVGDDLVYHRGPLMLAIYIIALFYVAFGVSYCIRYRNVISALDRSGSFVLTFIAIVGILVQGVFSLNIELFFESIAFLGFMLLLEVGHSETKGGRSEKMSKSFIIVIALIFFTVVSMNINLIYHAGTDQSGRIGEVQLNSLRGELQHTISDSESYLLRYSMGLEQLLNESADLDRIEQYVRKQRDYYSDLTNGVCINAYAASEKWNVMPDFDMPEGYDPLERVWYTGAKKHPGAVFITEPYIDADTGALCYTFSNLLSDGKTVVAMDYSLESVQDVVVRMSYNGDQMSMIVTDDGTIVGCSETGYQGEALSKVMPEYMDAFERVSASMEHRSFNTRINGRNTIIFSSVTDNGWKLILAVDYASYFEAIKNQMIMLAAIDLLMVAVIIIFYMISVNNQIRAENTLISTENFISGLSEDLRDPLNEIMRISDSYLKQGSDDEALRSISIAGSRLKEKMDNLFSYSSILKRDAEAGDDLSKKRRSISSASVKFIRRGITIILIAALLVGLALSVVTTIRWGSERISRENDSYGSEVELWMQKQVSILGMFSDVIAAEPGVLDDYDRMVKWLDDIAENYSEMTFAYMANPYSEHTIIMNNGWEPGEDSDFKVEERQWYIDTLNSADGLSVSAPYYDAQTGLYCITFSKIVYSKSGDSYGVFAIDCLMDKLIDVLDDSYSSDSYAFLVDPDGTIINHPFKDYEISETNNVNIEDTEYAEAYHKGSVFAMRDHDGRLVSCDAKKGKESGFTVVVVQGWWSIYGAVLLVGIIFLIMIVLSIVAVKHLIRRFTIWQESANRNLVEAVETAVAAEKAKSRFLAQMSHEIRTPINAVLGMNEMILRESDDPSIRDYSGNIRAAGRTLLALINSILDFSKIEEGKMEIVPVRYDTATMIEGMINSVSKRAVDKGLNLNTHIDRNLPSSMYGDDMRISQVTVNLLTNAVKYTQEGSVDFYIDGTRVDDEHIKLRITVKDTGIGIKEEDIDKLFESFTRLEEKRNRNIEGTGLGMGIVNGLLKMMGSHLEVESVYGKGSSFSFEVTQSIVDDSPVGDYEEKAREALEKPDEDKYLYAPDAKLLVVDDNDLNLKVISNLLKLNGIVPDTVMSGQEALDKLKDNEYDLVMLDHMMPQMDGIETLKNARESKLIPDDCAVIALTANAVVGARETYISAGFDDYLSKPVEVAALENTLGKYLPDYKVTYKSRSDNKKPAKVKDKAPVKEAPVESKAAPVKDIKAEPVKAYEVSPVRDTKAAEDTKKVSVTVYDSMVLRTKDGLRLYAGDEGFYRGLLRDYADSYTDRKALLEEALDAGDMGAYAEEVHTLKRLSQALGALEVAAAASGLEKAAKEGDISSVRSAHPKMLDKFKRAAEYIDTMK
ncbi:MAG: response regulator [Lachnospiraceae bacterium]|nr:response regulator [Lachnospiraceae bacterium]